MTIKRISSTGDLNNILQENTNVIINFGAAWSAPSNVMNSEFQKLAHANTNAGNLAFAEVNTDEHSEIAAAYNISGMPTFVLVNNGQVQETTRDASGIQGLINRAA
ncbi:thioredoxin-like protein [Microthyrium microscopicum]|uniref:Thioredoxin-like protein n=1 Tax=Microthyrium microscopicum TaxID=703497 RepID=A0A6A6UJB2_9PEZI|nr:thioredoxin-like protein [Microthyrium microscopicum]